MTELLLPVKVLTPPFNPRNLFPTVGKSIPQGEIHTTNGNAYTEALGPCIGVLAYTKDSLEKQIAVFGHLFCPTEWNAPEEPTRTSLTFLQKKLQELGEGQDIYVHITGGWMYEDHIFNVSEDRRSVLDALSKINISEDHIDKRWSEGAYIASLAISFGLNPHITHELTPNW